MVEQNLVPDDEQMRYDQEDDILMRIIHENSMRVQAEAQEKLDIEVKCEVAKYRAHLKKMRHLYHNAARFTATLAGAAAVVAGLYLKNGNALGVLVATISTYGLVSLTAFFDKKSRRKKERL